MTATIPDYQPPLGDAAPNDPPAPTPPQSPSGTSITSTGRSETAVQTLLSGVGENIAQQGTVALPGTLAAPVTLAGCTSVQQNSYATGAVGTTGSKFS